MSTIPDPTNSSPSSPRQLSPFNYFQLIKFLHIWIVEKEETHHELNKKSLHSLDFARLLKLEREKLQSSQIAWLTAQ